MILRLMSVGREDGDGGFVMGENEVLGGGPVMEVGEGGSEAVSSGVDGGVGFGVVRVVGKDLVEIGRGGLTVDEEVVEIRGGDGALRDASVDDARGGDGVLVGDGGGAAADEARKPTKEVRVKSGGGEGVEE